MQKMLRGSSKRLAVVGEEELACLPLAGLLVAGVLVELAGCGLAAVGVKTYRSVTEGSGAPLQLFEKETTDTSSLKIGCTLIRLISASSGERRRSPPIATSLPSVSPRNELATRVEIGSADVAEIVLPRSAAAVHSSVFKGRVVQLPNGRRITVPK